jgi:hypothetical protein
MASPVDVGGLPNHVKYCVSVLYPLFEQISVHHRSEFPTQATFNEPKKKCDIKAYVNHCLTQVLLGHWCPCLVLLVQKD